MERQIWEVDFDLSGPFTVESNFSLLKEKGFDADQFYSSVAVSRKPRGGIKVTITAYADSSESAYLVACVYFGRVKDVLSFLNEMPLQIESNEVSSLFQVNHSVRKMLKKRDFSIAFKIARKLEQEEPTILKALSWYAKGKVSSNPIDRYFSYWNVIEMIGKEYHTSTKRNEGDKVKNKIYQSFIDYFGPIEGWRLPNQWIDNMYDKRNSLFHGGEEVTYESIIEIAELNVSLEKTSYQLLKKVMESKNII